MLNKLFLSLFFFFFIQFGCFAQIGIGTLNPHESAILQVVSEDRGVLIPRLSSTERDNMPVPSEGIVIYNKTTKSLEFSNGTHWVNIRTLGQTPVLSSGTPTGNTGLLVGGHDPDPNGMLELKSTERSFIPPRFTNNNRANIIDPADGLMIYNLDTRCYQTFDGNANAWIDLCN